MIVAVLTLLPPARPVTIRPCTPMIRGARVLACQDPLRESGARLDSPRGAVLTSRPPRPARDASALSPPPLREPREHEEHEVSLGTSHR